ncbi:hypothetical protein [uncultured Shewanella sp.]|uniref:hypothetical protein n=1 Tax=uncultured Shewanella sp. TaxID=173975 RepID=UPI00261896E4|nr:hypothetical protein [uncultured Shewanella sp.]
MVNIIRKVITASVLLISHLVLAEVSHVSINQTLFEVGDTADFRVNIVAEDIDDVRFYMHDGESEERLSVEELNTFMLNVTGEVPVLSQEPLLIVHEYLDGEWQKRQQFSLKLSLPSSIQDNSIQKASDSQGQAVNNGVTLTNNTESTFANSSDIDVSSVSSKATESGLDTANLGSSAMVNQSAANNNVANVGGQNLSELNINSVSESDVGSSLSTANVDLNEEQVIAELTSSSATDTSQVSNIANTNNSISVNPSTIDTSVTATDTSQVSNIANTNHSMSTTPSAIDTSLAATDTSQMSNIANTNHSMSTNPSAIDTSVTATDTSQASNIANINHSMSTNPSTIDTSVTAADTSQTSNINNIDTNKIASQDINHSNKKDIKGSEDAHVIKKSNVPEPEFKAHGINAKVDTTHNMNIIESDNIVKANRESVVNKNNDIALENSFEMTPSKLVVTEGTIKAPTSVSQEVAKAEATCPILVAKDETLWKIDLRYHKQWGIGLFGGALALFEANPSAFNKGSIHGLKAGVRLSCPSHEILAKYQDESLAERFFLAM